MKVTILGGGGFRTPLTWRSLAEVAGDVGVDEVVLQDVGGSRLERIAAVIDAMRRERGGPAVRTTTDLVDAVEGADVVFCAIRVGGLAARVVDEAVPLREGFSGKRPSGPAGSPSPSEPSP